MTAKDKVPKGKLQELNAEGKYLRTHITSNATSRILAFNNLDEAYEAAYKAQLLRACSCGSSTRVIDMKLNGRFTCKLRFCIACCRYRSVKHRLAFSPSIDKIYQAHLADKHNNANLWVVTLTKPTVSFDELPNAFAELNKRWRSLYKAAKRKKLKNFSGLRKLECTANPIKGLDPKEVIGKEDFMYHAHLHILVHGRGNANFLRHGWLKRSPAAQKQCQDIRKFDGNIAEVLKYVAKPAHGKDAIMSASYSKAVGWIYYNLLGRRTFFSFGEIKKANAAELKEWEEANAEDAEELTDEKKQAIRADKTWAEDKVFSYDKKEHNFITDEGVKLVDKEDLDLDNPAHFSAKKIKAIRRFDGSKKSDAQAHEIDKETRALATAKERPQRC
jgi:hypothetical protein